MADRRAFTLLELVITVTIIGVLSSVATTRLGSMRSRSSLAATVGGIQGIAASFHLYYADNHELPGDRQPSEYPSEMEPYLRRGDFEAAPAIGGEWDWNGSDSSPWDMQGANISIFNTPAPTSRWQEFDSAFDDGSLTRGAYKRVPGISTNYCWMLGY